MDRVWIFPWIFSILYLVSSVTPDSNHNVRKKRGIFQFSSSSPSQIFQYDFIGDLNSLNIFTPQNQAPVITENSYYDDYYYNNNNPHPYFVSLEYNGRQFCGATVISNYFVITSAQCTHSYDPSHMKIRSGTEYLERGGKLHNIYQIIQHQKYNQKNKDFDFSLISTRNKFSPQLFAPLVENKYIVPEGTILTVIGRDSDQGYSLTTELGTQKIDSETCSDAYSGYGGITPRHFCGYEGKRCYGIPGSSITFQGYLYGIVSWGSRYPCLYSRISVVRSWIQQITGV